MPKVDTKVTTDSERQERKDFENTPSYPVQVKGYRIWDNQEESQVDRKAQLEKMFNDHVSRVMSNSICNRCGCCPCMCSEN